MWSDDLLFIVSSHYQDRRVFSPVAHEQLRVFVRRGNYDNSLLSHSKDLRGRRRLRQRQHQNPAVLRRWSRIDPPASDRSRGQGDRFRLPVAGWPAHADAMFCVTGRASDRNGVLISGEFGLRVFNGIEIAKVPGGSCRLLRYVSHGLVASARHQIDHLTVV
jgi:hypothetical protein